MEKEIEKMTKEEQLAQLKFINPDAHRILSAIIRARGKETKGMPNGFTYVRALQEYDKEEGIQSPKGLYTHMIKEYDKAVEPYKKK